MDTREPDAAPNSLDEPADVLEADPILDHLVRIERRLENLQFWFTLGATTLAAFFLLSCMVAVALKQIIGTGAPPDVFAGSGGLVPQPVGPPGTVPQPAGPPGADVPGLFQPVAGGPPGGRVTEETPLAAAAKVLVESGGQWWHGEVLDVLPEGRVKIHYSGWDQAQDEVVPRDRLRLPP